MALTLNSNAKFFETVFGAAHSVTQAANHLVAAYGAKFDIGLYTVTVTLGGKVYQEKLTVGATTLMKGTTDAVILEQNKTKIHQWLKQVVVSVGASLTVAEPAVVTEWSVVLTGVTAGSNPLLLIKAIRQLTGIGVAAAKHMIDHVPAVVLSKQTQEAAKTAQAKLQAVGALVQIGLESVFSAAKPVAPASVAVGPVVKEILKTLPSVAKPVDSVIHLRDAKAVGQKVHGTSAGSVYHCVALNARVRIAARLVKQGSVSIRAEWQGATKEELEQLTAAGLGMKAGYASMHVNAEHVPFGRIVGAFVVGTGIAWDQAILSGKDLVVEGK